MIGLENKTLHSERLTYRLLNDGDKAALREILADEDVTKPAGYLPAKTDTEFDDFFAALIQYNTGVAILLGEELIGYFHVNHYKVGGKFADCDCVGVGFALGKAYWRHGYGAEMLKTLTDYLLLTFDVCFADCFLDNDASRKTIEKCGYKFDEDYTMTFDGLGEEKTCHSYYYTHKNI